jgi:hypothetical protein
MPKIYQLEFKKGAKGKRNTTQKTLNVFGKGTKSLPENGTRKLKN